MIALAGNKADLANKRMVDYEEAKQYADENGLLFMETSAKTAVNVNDIFLAIGKSVGTGRLRGIKAQQLSRTKQLFAVALSRCACLSFSGVEGVFCL